jgi:GNAT superfamily N-acetyltransferase
VTVRLRPMREDEFPAYRASQQAGYAEDIERNGGMPRELAQQKAERDTATLYTHGLATPGLSVFVLEDEEAGEPIGNLALGERDVNGRKVMFVYDVVVDERHRGRGLGREAMLFAEEESRRRGIERIELNVFGGNDVARNLYRSLGYDELAVSMGKDVA